MPDETTITIESDLDVVAARQAGRQFAADLGFARIESTMIATAVSELARNIVMHARGGRLTLRQERERGRDCLVVIAADDGPGIPDVNRALQEGFSTAGSMGLGLPGVHRLMDEVVIDTAPNRGTTITARKYLK